MAIITNSGSMNYTVGTTPGTLTSNAVETDLNVNYAAQVEKGASPREFTPGSALTYQISTTNTGSGTLYSLSWTDDLGSGETLTPLTYVDGSASAFLYNEDGTQQTALDLTVVENETSIVFSVAEPLPAGSRIVITYDATVADTLPATETAIQNTVTMVSAEGDARGVLYRTTAAATTPRSAITMVKTASAATVNPGDPLTYTFTLTNIGDTAVDISSLTDQLPVNFAVNTVTASVNGTPATYAPTTDYTVSPANLLTLSPAAASVPLSIAAAAGGIPGTTTVTITGTVSA